MAAHAGRGIYEEGGRGGRGIYHLVRAATGTLTFTRPGFLAQRSYTAFYFYERASKRLDPFYCDSGYLLRT